MATFAELKTRVERRVIDLPSAVTAEVGTLVQQAHAELQRRHRFKVMEAITSSLVTTVATRALDDVPSDFIEFRGKPYVVENLGTTYDLYFANNRQAALDAFTATGDLDDGPPRLILDPEPDTAGDRDFEVFPLPDGNSDWSDGEYRIVVPYWRKLPAPASDGDTDWFTVNAEKFLVEYATGEAFLMNWDEQRAAVWLAKAEDSFIKVRRDDKRRRSSTIDTLAVHTGVRDPRISY